MCTRITRLWEFTTSLHAYGRVLRVVSIPSLTLMRSRLTAMLSISTVITIEQFRVLIRLQILEQSAIANRLFTSSFASVRAMPNERWNRYKYSSMSAVMPIRLRYHLTKYAWLVPGAEFEIQSQLYRSTWPSLGPSPKPASSPGPPKDRNEAEQPTCAVSDLHNWLCITIHMSIEQAETRTVVAMRLP